MLVYKFEVLPALIEAGYNTNILRQQGILSQSTIQRLRNDEMVNTVSLNRICSMLDMQPGNIIKFVEADDDLPSGVIAGGRKKK